jgi:hypothetical protein
MDDQNATGIVQGFVNSNGKLLKDVRNVFIAVAVGAVGYFLIELGKGVISAVAENGIHIPEYPAK